MMFQCFKILKEVEQSIIQVKEIKAETPTRTSARIAAKALHEGFSDDETEKVEAKDNVYIHSRYERAFSSYLSYHTSLLLLPPYC